MILRFVIVTLIVGIVVALLSLIRTPKEVTKEFFKEGFWVVMGTFIVMYWLAIFLKDLH